MMSQQQVDKLMSWVGTAAMAIIGFFCVFYFNMINNKLEEMDTRVNDSRERSQTNEIRFNDFKENIEDKMQEIKADTKEINAKLDRIIEQK
jgi:F0F1-type ATP synthase membrane subunit b/b'